jgi:hypothetical protein
LPTPGFPSLKTHLEASYAFPYGSFGGAWCEVENPISLGDLILAALTGAYGFKVIVFAVMMYFRGLCTAMLTAYGYLSVLTFNLFVLTSVFVGLVAVFGVRPSQLFAPIGRIKEELLGAVRAVAAPGVVTDVQTPLMRAVRYAEGVERRLLASQGAAARAAGYGVAALRSGTEWFFALWGAPVMAVLERFLHAVVAYRALLAALSEVSVRQLIAEGQRLRLRALVQTLRSPYAYAHDHLIDQRYLRMARYIDLAFDVAYLRTQRLLMRAVQTGVMYAAAPVARLAAVAQVVGWPAAFLSVFVQWRRYEDLVAEALKLRLPVKLQPYNLEYLARRYYGRDATPEEYADLISRIAKMPREDAERVLKMSTPERALADVYFGAGELRSASWASPSAVYAHFALRGDRERAEAVWRLHGAGLWPSFLAAVPERWRRDALAEAGRELSKCTDCGKVLEDLRRVFTYKPLQFYAELFYRSAYERESREELERVVRFRATFGMPALDQLVEQWDRVGRDPGLRLMIADADVAYSIVSKGAAHAVHSSRSDYRAIAAMAGYLPEAEPDALVKIYSAYAAGKPVVVEGRALTGDAVVRLGAEGVKVSELESLLGPGMARAVVAGGLIHAAEEYQRGVRKEPPSVPEAVDESYPEAFRRAVEHARKIVQEGPLTVQPLQPELQGTEGGGEGGGAPPQPPPPPEQPPPGAAAPRSLEEAAPRRGERDPLRELFERAGAGGATAEEALDAAAYRAWYLRAAGREEEARAEAAQLGLSWEEVERRARSYVERHAPDQLEAFDELSGRGRAPGARPAGGEAPAPGRPEAEESAGVYTRQPQAGKGGGAPPPPEGVAPAGRGAEGAAQTPAEGRQEAADTTAGGAGEARAREAAPQGAEEGGAGRRGTPLSPPGVQPGAPREAGEGRGGAEEAEERGDAYTPPPRASGPPEAEGAGALRPPADLYASRAPDRFGERREGGAPEAGGGAPEAEKRQEAPGGPRAAADRQGEVRAEGVEEGQGPGGAQPGAAVRKADAALRSPPDVQPGALQGAEEKRGGAEKAEEHAGVYTDAGAQKPSAEAGGARQPGEGAGGPVEAGSGGGLADRSATPLGAAPPEARGEPRGAERQEPARGAEGMQEEPAAGEREGAGGRGASADVRPPDGRGAQQAGEAQAERAYEAQQRSEEELLRALLEVYLEAPYLDKTVTVEDLERLGVSYWDYMDKTADAVLKRYATAEDMLNAAAYKAWRLKEAGREEEARRLAEEYGIDPNTVEDRAKKFLEKFSPPRRHRS